MINFLKAVKIALDTYKGSKCMCTYERYVLGKGMVNSNKTAYKFLERIDRLDFWRKMSLKVVMYIGDKIVTEALEQVEKEKAL